MLIWIIDDEFSQYEIEKEIIKKEYPLCEIVYSSSISSEDVINYGEKADGIICQVSIDINKEFINSLKNCKVISVYGAGYDNVDIEAAKNKGIYVTNIPGYCAEDVSEYVIAAMYRQNKKLSKYNSEIKNCLWGAQAVSEKIRRLSSQTLFIIGFGKIGKIVAKKAVALNMKVLVYSNHLSDNEALEYGVKKVELEEGLKNADFVSLNTSLNKDTKHMVSEKEINTMKKDAYIINTSRGAVIDEVALIKGIKEGKIIGATLDVVENEPPKGDEAILYAKGIKVTPHISYFSEDSIYELQKRAAENVVNILKGHIIDEIVNR